MYEFIEAIISDPKTFILELIAGLCMFASIPLMYILLCCLAP